MKSILAVVAAAIAITANAGDLEKRVAERIPAWKQMCSDVGLVPGSNRHQLCVAYLKGSYLDGMGDASTAAPNRLKAPLTMDCTSTGHGMLCIQMPPY